MLSRIVKGIANASRIIIGAAIDDALDDFAKWACKNYPGDKNAPRSTQHKGFRAYVITDHDGSPYMTRVLFPRVFGVRPFLHHIHRADFERDLHNHPWPWAASIILRGSYDEERVCERCDHGCEAHDKKRVRFFNFIRGSTFHRISELHGNVWTLFFTGKRTGEDKSWGFREYDPGYDGYIVTPNELYLHRQRYEREHGFESWSLEAWADDVKCPNPTRQPVTRSWEDSEGEMQSYEDTETDNEFTDRILAWVRK